MNWAAIVWLCLMILFITVEASTVSVVSLWFAAGALTALAASLFSAPVWLQITLFFAVSVCLLALLRPVVRKYLNPRLVRTNVDSVVGTQGLVTQTIDNVSSCGQVKLGAMEWSARSVDGGHIPAGTLVTVERIEGVKVFVTPVPVAAQTK